MFIKLNNSNLNLNPVNQSKFTTCLYPYLTQFDNFLYVIDWCESLKPESFLTDQIADNNLFIPGLMQFQRTAEYIYRSKNGDGQIVDNSGQGQLISWASSIMWYKVLPIFILRVYALSLCSCVLIKLLILCSKNWWNF